MNRQATGGHVFKKGNKSWKGNYGVVSVSSLQSSEALLGSKMLWEPTEVPSGHCRFVPDRYIIANLLRVIHDWIRNLDNTRSTDVIPWKLPTPLTEYLTHYFFKRWSIWELKPNLNGVKCDRTFKVFFLLISNPLTEYPTDDFFKRWSNWELETNLNGVMCDRTFKVFFLLISNPFVWVPHRRFLQTLE